MLLRRISVFLLVLLLVTTGYHLMKDSLQWKRSPSPLPPLRPFQPSIFPHPVFRKMDSTSVESDTVYRPLQQSISRPRRGQNRSLFYPTPF